MSTSKLTIPEKSPRSANSNKNDECLTDLNKKRGVIRGRLTSLVKYVNSLDSQLFISNPNKRTELQLRIEGAASFFCEFNAIQNEIELLVDDNELFHQLELREGFESSYYAIIAQAKGLLSSGEIVSSTNTNLHAVKLPTIAMPTFDGTYEHWLEYRDTFLSLVHNNKDITPIQKFHYLKSSLKSVAALVIDSLEFSSNNYTVAWDLLCNRYNNTRLLVHNHVKALFSIPNLVKESPTHIRKLIDTLLKNMRALKLLNEPVDSWDTLIIYMVVSKLDSTTEREWEQFRGSIPVDKGSGSSQDATPVVKVDHLVKFLKDRADMLETLMVTHSNTYKTSKQIPTTKVHCHVSPGVNNNNKNNSVQNNNNNSQHKKHKACLVCNCIHPIYACQTFINFSLQDKLKFVQDKHLCRNCLRSGHTLANCTFGSCRKCNQRHNTLIHDDQLTATTGAFASISNNKPVSYGVSNNLSDGNDRAAPSTYSHTAHLNNNEIRCGGSGSHPVLLSTALVEVADHNNKFHVARALLDSGSERSFITKRLCDLLNLPMIQSTLQIKGVGNSITNSTHSCVIDIKAQSNPFSMRFECVVLHELTSSLPPATIRSELLQIPKDIQLADPTFYESKRIDILIGADKFWDLLANGKMRLKNGPYLQNTSLGWIISGPIYTYNLQNDNLLASDNKSTNCNFTQSIDTQRKMVWELEELPKLNNPLSDEEVVCQKYFVQNTKHLGDGRFCVQIPFKQSPLLFKFKFK